MTRTIIFSVIFIQTAFVTYGQKKMKIDGDKLHLRDSLDGKIILVSSIERGQKNRDALWITYHRRPGLDPWTKDPKDWDETSLNIGVRME